MEWCHLPASCWPCGPAGSPNQARAQQRSWEGFEVALRLCGQRSCCHRQSLSKAGAKIWSLGAPSPELLGAFPGRKRNLLSPAQTLELWSLKVMEIQISFPPPELSWVLPALAVAFPVEVLKGSCRAGWGSASCWHTPGSHPPSAAFWLSYAQNWRIFAPGWHL